MNPFRLQRALVCLHYDPLLATRLAHAPAEVGALLGLERDELSALCQIDARAFRADLHRGDRLLTVLAEQFSASLTVLRLAGWSPRALPDFLSSLELRSAILSRSSTTAAFASWLSAAATFSEVAKPAHARERSSPQIFALAKETAAIEAAVAATRAARADRRAYETMRADDRLSRQVLVDAQLVRLAPWCVVVHASLRSMELVSQIRGILQDACSTSSQRVDGQAENAAAHREAPERDLSTRLAVVLSETAHLPRVRRALRLTQASDVPVPQLAEQRIDGEASISALSDELARLLLDAVPGISRTTLRSTVIAAGASEDDATSLLEDLVADCVLVPRELSPN